MGQLVSLHRHAHHAVGEYTAIKPAHFNASKYH